MIIGPMNIEVNCEPNPANRCHFNAKSMRILLYRYRCCFHAPESRTPFTQAHIHTPESSTWWQTDNIQRLDSYIDTYM